MTRSTIAGQCGGGSLLPRSELPVHAGALCPAPTAESKRWRSQSPAAELRPRTAGRVCLASRAHRTLPFFEQRFGTVSDSSLASPCRIVLTTDEILPRRLRDERRA